MSTSLSRLQWRLFKVFMSDYHSHRNMLLSVFWILIWKDRKKISLSFYLKVRQIFHILWLLHLSFELRYMYQYLLKSVKLKEIRNGRVMVLMPFFTEPHFQLLCYNLDTVMYSRHTCMSQSIRQNIKNRKIYPKIFFKNNPNLKQISYI